MMVAEAARNIVCSGGRPLAATNCLNFGNPEHPEVMWQFSEVVDGMSEACSAFETPITGGNVSFYNETLGGDIYPTPVLGMVGLIDNLAHVTSSFFKDAGDSIVLVETRRRDAGSIDLEGERALQGMVRDAIQDGLVKSAHDHQRRRPGSRHRRMLLCDARSSGNWCDCKNSFRSGSLQGPVRGVPLPYSSDVRKNLLKLSGAPERPDCAVRKSVLWAAVALF